MSMLVQAISPNADDNADIDYKRTYVHTYSCGDDHGRVTCDDSDDSDEYELEGYVSE